MLQGVPVIDAANFLSQVCVCGAAIVLALHTASLAHTKRCTHPSHVHCCTPAHRPARCNDTRAQDAAQLPPPHDVVQAVREAAVSWGFFQLVNHGLSRELLDAHYAAMQQ
jgi:hypothetical protein